MFYVADFDMPEAFHLETIVVAEPIRVNPEVVVGLPHLRLFSKYMHRHIAIDGVAGQSNPLRLHTSQSKEMPPLDSFQYDLNLFD